MKLTIRSGGILSSVQDLGRGGWQHIGIGPGGAMDCGALQIANLLVGNPPGEAGIEMTVRGAEVVFDEDSLVALCGGDFSVRVNERPAPMWRPLWIRKGAVLHVGYAQRGSRAYLAVAGQWKIPEVLGSKSTNLYAKFGGLAGRALTVGDEVEIGTITELGQRIADSLGRRSGSDHLTWPSWQVSQSLRPTTTMPHVIRVMPGPDSTLLSDEARVKMYAQLYLVSPAANRMGIQLQSDPIALSGDSEPISKPVVTGALQRLHSGQLTVLLADRQTTGGYPVLGVVAGSDLSKLAQVRPGEMVQFVPITYEQSMRLRARSRSVLRQLEIGLLQRLNERK